MEPMDAPSQTENVARTARASTRASGAPTATGGPSVNAKGTGASAIPVVPQGGGSGITHLSNRQGKEEGERETGGEDTVHLALNVFWRDDFDSLMQALEAAQEAAQQVRGLALLERGGQSFAVRRAGIKTGKGRGRYFRYVLQHRGSGVLFKLTDESQAHEQTPKVIAELGSTFLMSSRDIGSAWAEVKNIIEGLGGYVLWDKLSRLDVCADFPGWGMAPFRELIIDRNQAVTRARSRTLYEEHGRVTGVTQGVGSIGLRIYDKAYEVCVKKPDPAKRVLLETLRWNGPQETAVRIEYQLRREALKSVGIEGLHEYFRIRADLMGYLTSDWFRIADTPPDRENNNTQRAGVHPLWREVQTGFAVWAGQPVEVIRRERVKSTKDPVRLIKQAAGCLLAALAELDEPPPANLAELLAKTSECLAVGMEHAGELDVLRRYAQKCLERQSRGR